MALPEWAVHFPWPEIHDAAAEFGLDPSLIAAIIQVESGGMPLRIRAEPTFEFLNAPARYAERLGITKNTEIACQKMSWGLMQIMGATARDMGFEGHLTELIFPEAGIYWGSKYLGTRVKRYKSTKAAIAAYNAGSLRTLENGAIMNQKYVDKVTDFLDELK